MMLKIGDATDDGGYQIADIAHPSFFGGDLNQVRVTVRELYGDGARPEDHLEDMQKLAQLAVRELNDVQLEKTYVAADGTKHATFILTANEAIFAE